LNKHVTSVPVLSDDQTGVIDPVPGVPSSHFVYHSAAGASSGSARSSLEDASANGVAASRAASGYHNVHTAAGHHRQVYGALGGSSSLSDGDESSSSTSHPMSIGTPNRRPVVRPRRGLSHAMATHTPAAAYDEHL
jgi:hypothetical protein